MIDTIVSFFCDPFLRVSAEHGKELFAGEFLCLGDVLGKVVPVISQERYGLDHDLDCEFRS